MGVDACRFSLSSSTVLVIHLCEHLGSIGSRYHVIPTIHKIYNPSMLEAVISPAKGAGEGIRGLLPIITRCREESGVGRCIYPTE